MTRARRRLVVLARWPAPGRCKRRLAASCGCSTAAAAVQNALTVHTLVVAKAATCQADAHLSLAIDGLGPRAIQRWGRSLGVSHCHGQGDGGLGCRMQRQLQGAFRCGAEQVVLIGSDLPRIENGDITATFEALEEQPLVLGPARDGGYWLIGLNRAGFERAGARLMAGMPWGGPQVLERTLAAAETLGLEAGLLRLQSDLDRRTDLTPWQGHRHQARLIGSTRSGVA